MFESIFLKQEKNREALENVEYGGDTHCVPRRCVKTERYAKQVQQHFV